MCLKADAGVFHRIFGQLRRNIIKGTIYSIRAVKQIHIFGRYGAELYQYVDINDGIPEFRSVEHDGQLLLDFAGLYQS